MELGDTVYATATVVAISVLLLVPMNLVFGSDLWLVGTAVSVLIAALVTGLIFAGKLAEARRVSIALIAVLGAIVVLSLTFGILSLAAFRDISLTVNQAAARARFWHMIWAFQQISFYIVLLDAIAFVGIYVGSILRRFVRNPK